MSSGRDGFLKEHKNYIDCILNELTNRSYGWEHGPTISFGYLIDSYPQHGLQLFGGKRPIGGYKLILTLNDSLGKQLRQDGEESVISSSYLFSTLDILGKDKVSRDYLPMTPFLLSGSLSYVGPYSDTGMYEIDEKGLGVFIKVFKETEELPVWAKSNYNFNSIENLRDSLGNRKLLDLIKDSSKKIPAGI